ncbi:MAG: DUF3108 domain-containing protein [Firmicutes bacterium]|nr:DUF3108 domain-containing protein [Bacillota bacterium]
MKNDGGRLIVFTLFCLLILLLLSEPGFSRGSQLNPGERLEYQVFAKGLPVGEQSLTIIGWHDYQQEPVLHIRMQLTSYPALAFLFSYQETADLYLDPKNLTPVYLQRKLREQEKVWAEEYSFGEETVEKIVRNSKGETKVYTYQAADPLLEGISLVYYLRARPWQKDQYNFYYLTNKGPRLVEYQFVGEQRIRVRTDYVMADVVEDPVSQVTVWYSQDEKVYPLRIAVKSSVGILTSRLVKITSVED